MVGEVLDPSVLLYRSGELGPKEIQERLGHSRIRITFDRYGHLFPSLGERLKDGLDKAVEAGRIASADGDAAVRDSTPQ